MNSLLAISALSAILVLDEPKDFRTAVQIEAERIHQQHVQTYNDRQPRFERGISHE
jgi:hypothetical protein